MQEILSIIGGIDSTTVLRVSELVNRVMSITRDSVEVDITVCTPGGDLSSLVAIIGLWEHVRKFYRMRVHMTVCGELSSAGIFLPIMADSVQILEDTRFYLHPVGVKIHDDSRCAVEWSNSSLDIMRKLFGKLVTKHVNPDLVVINELGTYIFERPGHLSISQVQRIFPAWIS